MKQTQFFFMVLVLLLSAGCVKRQFHGVKPDDALMKKMSLFVKVESCNPVLKWKSSEEKGDSYDVVIFKALTSSNFNFTDVPEKGDQVFYREGIRRK